MRMKFQSWKIIMKELLRLIKIELLNIKMSSKKLNWIKIELIRDK